MVPRLHQDGFVFLPKWRPNEKTITIARSIGTVLDIPALLPQSNIPTVQTLAPRNSADSLRNQYSGTYGLTEFPLHTDLAHWAQPPRYMMLRCRVGSRAVNTRLLHSSVLISMFGETHLRHALTRPRRSQNHATLCLLPLFFCVDGNCGFRWDPLFTVPMNTLATQVGMIMSTNAWDKSKLVILSLANRDDTLIVDNWRCLHGRSTVPATDLERKVERVYLREIVT